MRKRKKGRKTRIIIIDLILLVLILAMFLFVKCRRRDAFTDKGPYKTVSFVGTWYKVNIDEITKVKFTEENYLETTLDNKKLKSGQYEIGNEALRLGDKIFSMKYIDEKEKYQDIIEEEEGDFHLKKYFYIVEENGAIIKYFRNETDAADLATDNLETNQYYNKVGLIDDEGFAVDESGTLLAYVGTEEEVTIPANVKTIDEDAFSADYDRALTTHTVIIPATVNSIKTGAFAFSNVSTVKITSGVDIVEDWAFGDSNIKDIYIPDAVPYFSLEAFDTVDGTNGLTIHCKETSPTGQYLKSKLKQDGWVMVND